MHAGRLCFQWLRGGIVNVRNGANKAEQRAENGAGATFWQRRRYKPAPLWLQRNSDEDEDIDAANRHFH
jgi:hypothetical protein